MVIGESAALDPGSGSRYRPGSAMNRVSLSSANGTPQAGLPDRSAATSPPDSPDPWPEMIAAGMISSPLAGEPGHGGTAVLRRQPVLIADGRAEHRYTGAFELICCECGDNPYLDYSRVSPRLHSTSDCPSSARRPECRQAATRPRVTSQLRPEAGTNGPA